MQKLIKNETRVENNDEVFFVVFILLSFLFHNNS